MSKNLATTWKTNCSNNNLQKGNENNKYAFRTNGEICKVPKWQVASSKWQVAGDVNKL